MTCAHGEIKSARFDGRGKLKRLIVILIATAAPAILCAHPLDESGIYHFTKIAATRDRLRFETTLTYKPYLAYYEYRDVDKNHDGKCDSMELLVYTAREFPAPAAQITLLVNGDTVPFRVRRQSRVVGQLGFLGELEFTFSFEIGLDTTRTDPFTITFIDNLNPAKLEPYKTGGINEISIDQTTPWFVFSDFEFGDFGHPGVHPSFFGWDPRAPDVRRVSFRLTPLQHAFGDPELERTYLEMRRRYEGGETKWEEIERFVARAVLDARIESDTAARVETQKTPTTYSNRATKIFFKKIPELFKTAVASPSGWFVLLAFAFVYGMQHAFMPGHGKSLIAAYLVGGNAGVSQAALLGTIVTVAHTGSVIVLGTIIYLWLHDPANGGSGGSTLSTLSTFWPFWLGSGLGVMLIGGWMFFKKFITVTREDSDPDGATPARRPTMKEVFILGISGGIVPCPSAILILNMAITLDAVKLGYFTVLSFSLGIATILIVIGVLTVKGKKLALAGVGRGFFKRLGPRRELFIELDAFFLHAFRLLPYLSFAAIVLIGAGMAWFGVWMIR